MSFLRRLYEGWLMVAGRFGSVQTLVLLGFFYFALIGPTSLIARAARRDLLDRRLSKGADSVWREADTSQPDLERAKLAS